MLNVNHLTRHIKVINKSGKHNDLLPNFLVSGCVIILSIHFMYDCMQVDVHISFMYTSFGAGTPKRHMFPDMAT